MTYLINWIYIQSWSSIKETARNNAIESRCVPTNFWIGMLNTFRFRVREKSFFPRAQSSYYRCAVLEKYRLTHENRALRIIRMQHVCVRNQLSLSLSITFFISYFISFPFSLFIFLCAPPFFCPLSPNSGYTSSLLVVFIPMLYNWRSYGERARTTYTRFTKPRVFYLPQHSKLEWMIIPYIENNYYTFINW